MLESFADSGLKRARYPPLELAGILDSYGAMKKEIPSPYFLSVSFALILKEKWAVISDCFPVVLSQSCTGFENEARPAL